MHKLAVVVVAVQHQNEHQRDAQLNLREGNTILKNKNTIFINSLNTKLTHRQNGVDLANESFAHTLLGEIESFHFHSFRILGINESASLMGIWHRRERLLGLDQRHESGTLWHRIAGIDEADLGTRDAWAAGHWVWRILLVASRRVTRLWLLWVWVGFVVGI